MQMIAKITQCLMMVFIVFYTASAQCEGIKIYQKNLHLSEIHKKELAEDIARYHKADNLWDVLREEFTLPHYEDNPAVRERIEWFMHNQEYILRSATRAAPYLYYIWQEVQKRHLPAEIVLLPILESGYNPFSRSNVGAAGIWQLMPDTATDRGIRQDWWYDGRRDIIASTRGALDYLLYLQSFFDGKWLLAIAAYNTGEGNVLSAIKRNIRNGRDTSFWSLPVAQQTRDYVPSLLALATIISHPEEYPLYFPPVRNAPYLAQIDVGSQINLKFAAGIAGLSYRKLMELNPGFNGPSTSSKGPYKLILPLENVQQFSENLSRSPLNKDGSWLKYKIKTGDTLFVLAKKFDTDVATLKKVNRLKNNILRPGAIVFVPLITESPLEQIKLLAQDKTEGRAKAVSSVQDIDRKLRYTLEGGDTIYVVRANDTLQSIANKFHIKKSTLQAINNVNDKTISLGKQLIIPTHKQDNDNSVNNSNSRDKIYIVKHGDTIEKIARKFKTSPAALRLVNLVDNDSLAEGEKLVVPTRFHS